MHRWIAARWGVRRHAAVATVVVCIAAALAADARKGSGDRLPPETIEVRQRMFGVENVDPRTGAVDRGEVHLSWLSVATFAAAIDGHVLLLDAYIHKVEDEPHYVPATNEDLVRLAPEAIFVGHGHFDHAYEAPTVAAATGATVYGTAAHCGQFKDAEPSIACVEVFQGPDPAMGSTATFSLHPHLCVTAVVHEHSDFEPPDPERDVTNQVVPVPDPGAVLLHPPGSAFGLEGEEGGTVLYQFRVGHFTLTWNDSAGPLKERSPETFDVFRSLPATDVHVGAILGFNQLSNGLRDPVMYIDALDPIVFIPNHHDFVTEYGSADDYEAPLRRELEGYDADPEIRFLVDPTDYVRPSLLAFALDDPRWRTNETVPCRT